MASLAALAVPSELLLQCVASAPTAAEALQSVCAAAMTCRALRRAAHAEGVWQALALRLWPSSGALADAPPPCGWRAFVRARTLAQRRFEAEPQPARTWTLGDFQLFFDVKAASDDETLLCSAPLASLPLPMNPAALLQVQQRERNSVKNLCEVALPASVDTWPQKVHIRVLVLRSDGALAVLMEAPVEEAGYRSVKLYELQTGLLYESHTHGNVLCAEISLHAEAAAVTVRSTGSINDNGGINMLTSEFVETLGERLLWLRPYEPRLSRLLHPLGDAPVIAADAIASVLSQPALLSALLSFLPLHDIASASLTCVAFAAAARRDDTWRCAMHLREAPALSTILAASAPFVCWRALSRQLDAAQRRAYVHGQVNSRGYARFDSRRRGRRTDAEDGSSDDEGSHSKPRVVTLQDFVFFVDATYEPLVAGDAGALSAPSQRTRIFSAALTMPTHDTGSEGNDGELHMAHAPNGLLAFIDAAAAASEPAVESEDDESEPPPPESFDPHKEFSRDSCDWWNEFDSFRSDKVIKLTLTAMRRTDGAVAVLSTPARSRLEAQDSYPDGGGLLLLNWRWKARNCSFLRYKKWENVCSVSAELSLGFNWPEFVDHKHRWTHLCPAYVFDAASLSWETSAHMARGDHYWDEWDSLPEDVTATLCKLDWQEA